MIQNLIQYYWNNVKIMKIKFLTYAYFLTMHTKKKTSSAVLMLANTNKKFSRCDVKYQVELCVYYLSIMHKIDKNSLHITVARISLLLHFL